MGPRAHTGYVGTVMMYSPRAALEPMQQLIHIAHRLTVYKQTLTAMLPKTMDKKGPKWDVKLRYVLFTYQAASSCQQRSLHFSYCMGCIHYCQLLQFVAKVVTNLQRSHSIQSRTVLPDVRGLGTHSAAYHKGPEAPEGYL